MTSIEDKIFCPTCNYSNRRNAFQCFKCGSSLGAPNVNSIDTLVEKNALDLRYRNAKLNSSSKQLLEDFENEVKEKGKAVINVDLQYLKSIVLETEPYKSYHILIEENVREIAKDFDDRKRGKVEGFLFGLNLARKITYAALSINNEGLLGYGKVTIVLYNNAIEKRASLLEENSYDFVLRNNLIVKDNIPTGFRALWNEKHKLAVAKLYNDIKPQTIKEEFSRLLMFSDGIRQNEKFIEVHLFNPVFVDAFELIRVPSEAIVEFLETGRQRNKKNIIHKLKSKLGTRFQEV
jgi:hypothetical protein